MDSGIFRPGTSRHKEKNAARADLALRNLSATSTLLAEATGLHSFSYARDCKDTWHKFGHFLREKRGVRDMSTISGGYVEEYLLQRISDNITYGCWKKEAAHLGKLGNALRDWHAKNSQCVPDGVAGIRVAALDAELRMMARENLARDGKDFGHFFQPEAVIAHLETGYRPEYALVARIQFEGGARCREACRIAGGQLHGTAVDPFTGSTCGQLHLTDTKGGKPRTIQVSLKTYSRLEQFIKQGNGVLQVPTGSYAAAVRASARQAGEELAGTHAFRYCFARDRYRDLTDPRPGRQAYSHEAVIQQISWEMGHQRANITHHYLR